MALFTSSSQHCTAAHMDVAGSAVGIIFLDMQCCQGLMKYYDSWKGQDQAVTATCQSLESLGITLVVLRKAITGREFPVGAISIVEDNITPCEEGIDSLRRKLEKVQNNVLSSAFRDRVRLEGKRLLYPFRESTLMKLREIVQEIRAQLKLALATLQM